MPLLSHDAFVHGFSLSPATPTSESNKKAIENAFSRIRPTVGMTVLRLLGLLPSFAAGFCSFPFYCVSSLVYGRPPNVTPVFSTLRHIGLSVFAPPRIPLHDRANLSLALWQKLFLTPLCGFSWHLDELLYRRSMNSIRIESPVFVISGARSGSTTLGHLLDEDPAFVSPSAIMSAFPYMWLWNIVATLSDWSLLPTKERALTIILKHAASFASEFLARHELNPFKPDTWEVPFLWQRTFLWVSYDLGAEVMMDSMPVSSRTHDPQLWSDFEAFTDATLRKTLLWNGVTGAAGGANKRCLIKGHFMSSAAVLERKYPSASFVTVVRDPIERMESLMNFVLSNRLLHITGCVPCKQNLIDVGECITRIEVEYCKIEKEFFSADDTSEKKRKRKVVVPFKEYVANPALAVAKVYHVIGLNGETPPAIKHALTTGKEGHDARGKVKYFIKLNLGEFGVDAAKVKEATGDLWDLQ